MQSTASSASSGGFAGRFVRSPVRRAAMIRLRIARVDEGGADSCVAWGSTGCGWWSRAAGRRFAGQFADLALKTTCVSRLPGGWPEATAFLCPASGDAEGLATARETPMV